MPARDALHQHAFCSSPVSLSNPLYFSRRLAGFALALLLCTAPPLLARDVAVTGEDGANGTSGIRGGPGGQGENGRVAQGSADLNNNITATGGKGGNGGSSFPLLPGGKGGNGGAANSALVSGGQLYPPDTEVQSAGHVVATGGAGGNGGNGGRGLVRGNGGAGGGASAKATDTGAAGPETDVSFLLRVDATGGKGGVGANGGAGGKGTAFGRIGQGVTSADNTGTVAARGGDGGNASALGGSGGAADAEASLGIHADPHYGNINAVAIGGKGGNSALGLHGNGGAASANANATLSKGDIGVNLTATATGGDSGSGGLLRLTGNGGNAIAKSKGGDNGYGNEVTEASARSAARGGKGVVNGGSALATARAIGQLNADAVAEAHGGAGRNAGAAVAAAHASNTLGHNYSAATATATYAGPFVREVSVDGLTTRSAATGEVYTRASVGNSDALLASLPAEPPRASLTALASAPTTAQAAAALAGNDTVAATFASGSVWGLGEFDTSGRRSDRNEATASFTFDIRSIADPQHLWLGLLDAEPGFRNVDFDFSVRVEGAQLFAQNFAGADYLSFFDDRAFDLGSWAGLVGSDGLLNFDVSFSGYVPAIEFAFGDAAAGLKADTAVPEPTTLVLMLAGLLGVIASRWLRRHHDPFTFQATASALILVLWVGLSLPVLAADVDATGSAGGDGASGVLGKKGGNGEGAAAVITTSDFFNTAVASGGKGGNGGNSFPLLPGANGGSGGRADANVTAVDLPFIGYEDSYSNNTVSAHGGDGGNGGNGLLRGNGGAGGAASAGSVTLVPVPGIYWIIQEALVTAGGGNGGGGRNGGNGGSSDARGSLESASDGSYLLITANGGNGGSATLQGGRGGDANAISHYRGGGQPADNYSVAIADGGRGGDSALGRNGDGGNASAIADGSHSSRGLGVIVQATAIGGDSGQGGPARIARGRGGDAHAFASGTAFNLPTDAAARSTATGGNGARRGGDAVATTIQSAPLGGSEPATATATGGSGRQAGAAIATATDNSDYFGGAYAASTANSAGDFVRQVKVDALVTQPFTDAHGPVAATVYTQARVGDTAGILATTPAPSDAPGLVARAAAPTSNEATAALAGNPNASALFAGGKVWGIGDFAANNSAEGDASVFQPFDELTATSSYTFEISGLSHPKNLWLGLLDSALPGDAIGNFHFSVTGEGTTLFERDFTGSDFLTFFDDRLFDLGSWSSLAGSDGLLDLAVSFSGYVPAIEFAFGEAGDSAAVPEPSTWALLIAATFGIAQHRRRALRRLASGALAAALVVSLPAFAETVTDIGGAGSNGTSGVRGAKGGSGEGAAVYILSDDFSNQATAKGGKGGNGGNSNPQLYPGGAGGKGGAATASLQAQDQPYPDTEITVDSTVLATGGNGGNGGSGLLRGNGGAGGAATATGADNGGIVTDFAFPGVIVDVTSLGGKGGGGRNGGNGGASTATANLSGSPASPGVATARATGGAGGTGQLRGGNGGAAHAATFYNAGGMPSDAYARAIASGGHGGTSQSGLNGNGGEATATVSATHSARDLELQAEARAIGGNSGTKGLFTGNGGDAYARAIGHAQHVASVDPSAYAQGGNGVVRGGNAIAIAEATSDLMFGGASAKAVGGSGQKAGAAVATASSTSPYLGNSVTATATYAGDFVREVTAVSETFSLDNIVGSSLYAQARAGDTSGLAGSPAAPADANGVTRAYAPTAKEAKTALAGHGAVSTAFAQGSVWGIGEFTGTSGADEQAGLAAYTFDVSKLGDSHLWLGLLDSDLPDNSVGNFHFSVAGEGTTLFERDFTGTDFLSFFDDRLFDLGSWASLVGSDGLFDLAVSFQGYVPAIEFAFGTLAQGASNASAVPEPSLLPLLGAGLFAATFLRKRRQR